MPRGLRRKPRIKPELVHPSHKIIIWPIDKEKTKYNENLNVLHNIAYDESNAFEFECQYKVPFQNAMGRLQVSRVQGVFVEDIQGYILAHRRNLILDGEIRVKRGDLIKQLIEVETGVAIKLDAFVKTVEPIGQYDIAYLYKIQIEDRELDRAESTPSKPKPRI